MIKRVLFIAAILGLSACSLPTRAPLASASWMVAPERTAAPLKTLDPLVVQEAAELHP